eukprot:TRINITY_DN40198_c0_g1_i1.p1 TRINITY_DN40198_c0_g1~~TRINITY_DN40198_c0_g1_i1.p1  ORF type:complete len:489 (+),score=79.65 TRINITY_DN40198_c0_g1_i1:29-1495(+)
MRQCFATCPSQICLVHFFLIPGYLDAVHLPGFILEGSELSGTNSFDEAAINRHAGDATSTAPVAASLAGSGSNDDVQTLVAMARMLLDDAKHESNSVLANVSMDQEFATAPSAKTTMPPFPGTLVFLSSTSSPSREQRLEGKRNVTMRVTKNIISDAKKQEKKLTRAQRRTAIEKLAYQKDLASATTSVAKRRASEKTMLINKIMTEESRAKAALESRIRRLLRRNVRVLKRTNSTQALRLAGKAEHVLKRISSSLVPFQSNRHKGAAAITKRTDELMIEPRKSLYLARETMAMAQTPQEKAATRRAFRASKAYFKAAKRRQLMLLKREAKRHVAAAYKALSFVQATRKHMLRLLRKQLKAARGKGRGTSGKSSQLREHSAVKLQSRAKKAMTIAQQALFASALSMDPRMTELASSALQRAWKQRNDGKAVAQFLKTRDLLGLADFDGSGGKSGEGSGKGGGQTQRKEEQQKRELTITIGSVAARKAV